MPCIPLGYRSFLCMPKIHSLTLDSGREIEFELPNYCGPMPLTKKGIAMDPKHIPKEFWVKLDVWQANNRYDGAEYVKEN